MDISKIQSFLTLAKVKNFAVAADILYISQPALSKRIQALENELGVHLFDRMGNGTYLTIHGDAFLEFAEKIYASYHSAKEYIKQIESLEHGTLNFGATNFIGAYLMPKVIAAFQIKFPRITINMVINSSRTILDMLHKNQLEFVMVSDYINLDGEQYLATPYIQDRLKLVVGKEHRLFNKGICRLEDVKNDLYVTKEEHSSQYKYIQKLFDRHHFDFTGKLYIGSQEAIKECVVNNVGVAIISETAVEREVHGGLLSALTIEDMDITRNIMYAYNRNRLLTPAALEFIHILEDAHRIETGCPAKSEDHRSKRKSNFKPK